MEKLKVQEQKDKTLKNAARYTQKLGVSNFPN
jgi:hypothetical protein